MTLNTQPHLKLIGYASAADILDAIRRANSGELQDGTYHIVGSWVGSSRVWMAEHVSEVHGYEVAWESAEGGSNLNGIYGENRWGLWTDAGVIYLDRTMHVNAPAGVALDIARMYAQEAVWDWSRQASVPTSDPATAL